MKQIRIVHLFPELLSLYGEYGNVAILVKYLRENGFAVTVDRYEEGPLALDGADFVYMGSGTEDNLLVAASRAAELHLRPSVYSQTTWLVTGNAMSVLGSGITVRGQTHAAASVFDYDTEFDLDRRFSGDVLAYGDEMLKSPLVGYINTSSVYRGVSSPLFRLALNPSFGNDKVSDADGMRSGRFFATQLIGPVLVKNPEFLALIYSYVSGAELQPSSDMVRAHDMALAALQKRL